MDTKTIKDSAGVNYTLSNHPMFQNCSCVSWQEGIRTFRYYWSMEEEPNPERWRSKSPLGIIGHDPEPPKFIGKGLDIILAKGETEVLNVLAIRPEFTQYGTSTPEYGGRRDHNDYNLSQDLSGLVRYADEPYGIYRILMEREKGTVPMYLDIWIKDIDENI